MESPGPSFGKEYFDKAYGGDYGRRNPPRKLDFHLRCVREAKPSGRLLDVGCACGDFVDRARRFYEASGCDVSEYAVRTAKERFPGLNFFRAAIGELPLGELYDVITCFDLLEHVPDLEAAFEALSLRLASGGVLVLSVPVYDGPAGWLVGLLDRDDTHLWKRGRNFWRDELRSHGFAIVRDVGLWRYFLLDRFYIFFGGSAFRNFSPALLLIGTRPHFSPRFVARWWRRVWIQGARRENDADVVDTTARRATERNAVGAPGSASVVEAWRELRAGS